MFEIFQFILFHSSWNRKKWNQTPHRPFDAVVLFEQVVLYADRYNMKPQNYKYELHVVMQLEGIFGTSPLGPVSGTGKSHAVPSAHCVSQALVWLCREGTPQYWFNSLALFLGKVSPRAPGRRTRPHQGTNCCGRAVRPPACSSATLFAEGKGCGSMETFLPEGLVQDGAQKPVE